MYWRVMAALAAGLAVASCGGNPLGNEPDCGEVPFGGDTCDDDGSGSVADLPGTENPSASRSIERYEATAADTGSGYAENITFDPDTNTFSVDGLAFDGDNSYGEVDYTATDLGTYLGDFRVYEAAATATDPVGGVTINQFEHKLLAGVSTSGDTEFAVVRTGAYVGYGFGGFILKRNVGVSLPSSGQAGYQGNYAALRDFEGRGGLEYATGDMTMAIDFEDFNDGDGVRGRISNRRIFDSSGAEITSDVIDAWAADTSVAQTTLPVVTFVVGPGVIDTNGELNGELASNIQMADGSLQEFESGNYYAIVAGDQADEVVGIIVVEADDPRYDGVTVRETGGFILYRDVTP